MNKRIVDREKVAKYISKSLNCSKEYSDMLIDDGVANIKFLNIKYLGFGKFEILFKEVK